MGKSRSKEDREHLTKLAEVGCIVCRLELSVFTPAEIHHIRAGQGLAQRASDKDAIPLCFHHHSAQGVDGFHKHPKTWQEAHGTELELLDQTRRLLDDV